MFCKRRFVLILLLISVLCTPVFSKKKNPISIPTKVQEKINNTADSPKCWYICELKSKTKAGNVLCGPVESRELILLVWIANSCVPDKNLCIAKNKTYITKNPEKFFAEDFAQVKNDITEFGLAETYEKYFFTNYLTLAGKLTISSDEMISTETENEASTTEATEEATPNAPEQEAEVAAETTTEPEKEAAPEQEPASEVQPEPQSEPEPAPTAEPEPVAEKPAEPAPAPAPEPVSEPIAEPVPEPAPAEKTTPAKEETEVTQQTSVPEQTIIKEPEPLPEPVAVKETTPAPAAEPAQKDSTTVEYDNLLFSKLNQDQENVTSVQQTQKPVVEPIGSNLKNTEEKQPEPVPEPKPVATPEPVQEEPQKPAYELPISTEASIPLNRYQKENLLDYAPKKTIPLPENEDFSKYSTISNPDQKDSNGITLLMKAAKAGNDWELKNLLSSGANVNLEDKDGWTALMYAVRYQENTSIVDQLITAGSNVKHKNKLELSALSLAATYNGNPEILRKLLSYYTPSEKELMQAFTLMLSDNSSSEYSKSAKVDTFIEKSITLNSFYNGKTPLMYAAQYSSSTLVIKKLLDYGASASIRTADGKTAFDFAKQNPSLPHDDIYWALNKK